MQPAFGTGSKSGLGQPSGPDPKRQKLFWPLGFIKQQPFRTHGRSVMISHEALTSGVLVLASITPHSLPVQALDVDTWPGLPRQ